MSAVRRLLAVLLFVVASFGATEGDCRTNVTVAKLLEQKASYGGRDVCVTGLLKIEFEGNELYDGDSRIWLQFSPRDMSDGSFARLRQQLAEWERHYQHQCVVVRGRFNLKENGHLGMWPAGLYQIKSIAKSGACRVNKR